MISPKNLFFFDQKIHKTFFSLKKLCHQKNFFHHKKITIFFVTNKKNHKKIFKLKLWQNPKTLMWQLNNSNCNYSKTKTVTTQKVKLWQNSEIQIVISQKLKLGQNSKTGNMTNQKLKLWINPINPNFEDTQKLKFWKTKQKLKLWQNTKLKFWQLNSWQNFKKSFGKNNLTSWQLIRCTLGSVLLSPNVS